MSGKLTSGVRGAIRAVLLVALLGCAVAESAQAAAAWQWTKGQGWTEGLGTARETPRDQLQHALGLERKAEYRDAARQYFLLIKVFPDSDEAGIALQRLAKCLFEMENYYESFKAIEQVIETYPHTGRLADLVAIEYRIGLKLLRNKARVSILDDDPEVIERKSLEAAKEVFSAMLKRDPYGQYADNALLALGEAYLGLKEPELAREQFMRLLNEFNKSKLVDHARLGVKRADVMLGQANPGDVKPLVDRIRQERLSGTEASQDKEAAGVPEVGMDLEESISELEEGEAKKMWDSAQFYFRRGGARYIKSGEFTLQELVRRFPRTTYAAKARKRLTAAGVELPKETKAGRWVRLPEIDLSNLRWLPNPFRDDEEASFTTPQVKGEAVKSDDVFVPVPGVEASPTGNSAATTMPAAPQARPAIPPSPQITPAPYPDEQPAARPAPRLPYKHQLSEAEWDTPASKPVAPTREGETPPSGGVGLVPGARTAPPAPKRPLADRIGQAPEVPEGAEGSGWDFDLDEDGAPDGGAGLAPAGVEKPLPLRPSAPAPAPAPAPGLQPAVPVEGGPLPPPMEQGEGLLEPAAPPMEESGVGLAPAAPAPPPVEETGGLLEPAPLPMEDERPAEIAVPPAPRRSPGGAGLVPMGRKPESEPAPKKPDPEVRPPAMATPPAAAPVTTPAPSTEEPGNNGGWELGEDFEE